MQRLYGFAACISAGILCSFLSSLLWLKVGCCSLTPG